MALHFDLGDVNHIDTLTEPASAGHEEAARLANATIWACVAVGMREITPENWRDFWVRVHLTQVHEHPLGPGRLLMSRDVHDHVGLRTSMTQWTRKRSWTTLFARLRPK